VVLEKNKSGNRLHDTPYRNWYRDLCVMGRHRRISANDAKVVITIKLLRLYLFHLLTLCSNEIKVLDNGIAMKFGGFSHKLPVLSLFSFMLI